MGRSKSIPMTIKALRQNAPERDRNDAALVPSKPVQWTTARDGSRYLAIHLYPRNLAELCGMGREFGEAAVSDACWGAISSWLMREYPSADLLRNPFATVCDAVLTWAEYERWSLGWPHHAGEEWKTPAFNGLKPEHQREIQRVAVETLEAWEVAGCPKLCEESIKTTYQYLTSTPAFINKYVGQDNGLSAQEQTCHP